MSIPTHSVNRPEKTRLSWRRKAAIAGTAAGIVLLAAIGLTGWLVARDKAAKAKAEENAARERQQAADMLRANNQSLIRHAFRDTNNSSGPSLLNALEDALTEQPTDLALWQAKIEVLTRANQLNEALDSLGKAMNLADADPNPPHELPIELLLARSRVFRQMGRQREADMDYFEAGRINCQRRGISTRKPQTKPEMLDLSPFLQSSLSTFLDTLSTDGREAANTISEEVKRDTGVEFDLRGGLNVLGRTKNSPPPYQLLSRPPELLRGIAVNRRFQWLHVLHSVWGPSAYNTRIAVYVLHYADGQIREIPVLYGHHVRDVWRRDTTPPMEGLVAWKGESSGANQDSRGVQLFKTTWENPRPEAEVQSIDLSLPSKDLHPILLGITVEEAMPSSPEFWTTKAKSLEGQGRIDEALKTHDQAMQQLLDNPVLWDSKGGLLARADRTNEAFQAYTKAIEIAARDTNAFQKVLKSALLGRSSLLNGMGRFEEAGTDNCRARRIPIRDPQTPPELLDLSRFYHSSLGQFLPSRERESTEILARFARQKTGVSFDARGYFGVYGKGVERDVHVTYPQSVTGIPINRRLTRLHFLHASIYRSADGTEIGSYVLHFSDGQTETLPIIHGEDVTDELKYRTSPLARAKLAWPGSRTKLPIYQVTWTNPHPDVEIKSLEFVSAGTETSPLLIAITVE